MNTAGGKKKKKTAEYEELVKTAEVLTVYTLTHSYLSINRDSLLCEADGYFIS